MTLDELCNANKQHRSSSGEAVDRNCGGVDVDKRSASFAIDADRTDGLH